MGDWADYALKRYINRPTGKIKKLPTIVVCRDCGVKDLRWGQKKGGFWEVRNRDGSKHIC